MKRMCLLALMTLVVTSGCRDACQDLDCQNGGACIDGTCNCADGYTGADCSISVSTGFLGTYNVSETCPDIVSYTVNIFADSLDVNKVWIANFFNSFSNPVYAYINMNSITIPGQDPDFDGRSVSGAGNLFDQERIEWDYTVSSNNGVTGCDSSVWEKLP